MPIIKTIKGDLIKLAQQGVFYAIAHGCNCMNTMGRGIAPQIAKAFPNAYDADQATHNGNIDKLGTYSVGACKDNFGNDLKVYNLYTQYSFGVKPYSISYQAIADAFDLLSEYCYCEGRTPTIGIPMIGAGLGGGHWEAIRVIIDLITPDLNIILVEYQP